MAVLILFSTGGSRAANGNAFPLRASCRSNLYERAHLPAIRTLVPAHYDPIPDIAVEAMMNSPAQLPAHRVDHAPSDVLEDCAQQTAVQLHETASDPKLRIEPTQVEDLRSPLWAVAIGTACLFAAMAAVMAFG